MNEVRASRCVLTVLPGDAPKIAVWKKGGGWYYDEPKTSRARRTIPLPASMVAQLRAYRRIQAEERIRAGSEYQNNELVFATEFGTPLGTYSHVLPDMQRGAAEKLEKLVFAGVGTL